MEHSNFNVSQSVAKLNKCILIDENANHCWVARATSLRRELFGVYVRHVFAKVFLGEN